MKPEETLHSPSASKNKVLLQDEKPKAKPVEGIVNLLMVKKGKFIQPQRRTYLKWNFLQVEISLHQQLLVSANKTSKVAAIDALVEVAEDKCQWLVVENRSMNTVHVKRGAEIAEVSLLDDVYDVPEELLKQEEQRRK